MRLSKAWIVASKDFKTFTKKKSILYTLVYFELIVSIGIPFIIRYAETKTNRVDYLPNLLGAFSFLYVVGAALAPLGIAAYSLVGEKVKISLEPLMATPTRDEEILTRWK
jgi:hypothetical protein